MVHVLKEMQLAYPDVLTDENLKKFSGHLEKMIKRMARNKKSHLNK